MSPIENSWQLETDRFQEELPLERRKRDGVWFTPIELALPTARRALEPLAARPLRICDPASGGGSFLLAAAQALRSNQPAGTHEYVGVDIDPTAAELARKALRHHGEHRLSIEVGDGLTDLEPESFDCVLTNPPWETLQSGEDAKARVAELRPRFRHQGSGKLYTYRLFVERAVHLLRPGGRLGLIVPASLWFDRDAEPLRQLLLDTCRWQWLFGFENRQRIFDIDSRYRFGAIIATKGGVTDRVQVAFGQTCLKDWAKEEPAHVSYHRDELQLLSPHSGAFVEVESRRDLDILARMTDRGRPLLGEDGLLTWRQGDFNMTSDKDQFVRREEAEQRGYRHDGRGVWRCPGHDDLLALRQGAMIYDLQVNAGAHEAGVGHKTRWRKPHDQDQLVPLYLVAAEPWRAGAEQRQGARIGLRALSNATNERTAIACLLPDVPCGNSLGVLTPRAPSTTPLREMAAATAMLASLPFDWALRMRLGGTNLNRFVLTDCILPVVDTALATQLARLALRMCATTRWTDDLWETARREGWCDQSAAAVDAAHRRGLATEIDVAVATAFGLSRADVEWMTRGEPFRKGFWRIERNLSPSERRPRRWLNATN